MQILFILVKIKLDIFFIRKPGSKHKHRRHHRVVDVQTGIKYKYYRFIYPSDQDQRDKVLNRYII